MGISRGTTAAHIARAALEGIAFQAMDIVTAMSNDANIPLKSLKVDGGASRNNLMMQFQADILGIPVIRPATTETTALGSAFLAGLATGYWSSMDEIKGLVNMERCFNPLMDTESVTKAKAGWKDAIMRTLSNYTQKD